MEKISSKKSKSSNTTGGKATSNKSKPIKSPQRLNKSDILADVKQVIAATNLAEKVNNEALAFIFDLIVHVLKRRVIQNYHIVIPGFGKFFQTRAKGGGVRHLKNRTVEIGEHNVIRFRASETMRMLSNGKNLISPLAIPENLAVFAVPKKKSNKKPGRKPLNKQDILGKISNLKQNLEKLTKQFKTADLDADDKPNV